MIKRYVECIFPTYPPKYPYYWWCGCGYREEGGADEEIDESLYKEIWKIINKERKNDL